MKSSNLGFCILIPTRNRVNILKKIINILIKKTNNIKNVEIILGIDDDDQKTINLNTNNFKKKGLKILKVIMKRKAGYEDQPLRLKTMINHSKKDFFIHFADDMMIETKDWDLVLIDKIKKLPKDKIFLLYPNHNQKNKDWPLCQIISKKWTKTTKKFTNYFETDTELLIMSSILKRKFKINNFKIKHLFYKNFDKTFIEGRAQVLKQKYNKKSVLSISSLYKVFLDTEKLSEKINSNPQIIILRVLKILIMFLPRILKLKKKYHLNYFKLFLRNLLYFKL